MRIYPLFFACALVLATKWRQTPSKVITWFLIRQNKSFHFVHDLINIFLHIWLHTKSINIPFFCTFNRSQHGVYKSNLTQTPPKNEFKKNKPKRKLTIHDDWLDSGCQAWPRSCSLSHRVSHTQHQRHPVKSLISMQLHTASSQADRRCLPLEEEYMIIIFRW